MLTNESNYLDIDLEYLEKVVFKNCLEDEIYLNSIIDNLNYKFFKNLDFQQIVKIIQALYRKNNRIPTHTELELYLNTDQLKNHYKRSKKLIDALDVELSNDVLLSYTEKFLQEQAVFNTFLEIVDNKERDVKSIHDKFSKACNISITTNTGHNYFKEVEQHIVDLTTKEEKIKTGWNWLDTRLGGGFLEQGRSMYIFAGPTNVGKSIFLSNIASNAAAEGKNVLVVSLEMSEMIYCKRITSKLTGLPVNHLDDHVGELRDKLGKFKMTHPRANIIIKEFAPSSIPHLNLKVLLKN